MTIFIKRGTGFKKRIVRAGQSYTTSLLPGFELPLNKLLAIADAWDETEE